MCSEGFVKRLETYYRQTHLGTEKFQKLLGDRSTVIRRPFGAPTRPTSDNPAARNPIYSSRIGAWQPNGRSKQRAISSFRNSLWASSARRNSIRRSRLTPHTSDRPVQKRPIQKRPCAHRYDECAPPEALPRSSPTDSPVPAALGARRHGQRSENSDQPSSPIVRRMSTIRRWKWRMLWMLRRVGPSISSAIKRCRR